MFSLLKDQKVMIVVASLYYSQKWTQTYLINLSTDQKKYNITGKMQTTEQDAKTSSFTMTASRYTR